MFHCGGIAALTLLVNATTAAPLLRYLGLARTEKDGGLQVLLENRQDLWSNLPTKNTIQEVNTYDFSKSTDQPDQFSIGVALNIFKHL